jgi:galactose mutarotase-like enzyme
MLQLSNGTYSITVDPNHGGKITSLIYLPKGIELLVPPPIVEATTTSDERWPLRFTLADSYGWDEMFPTIDADENISLPWGPVDFPDHGDLWSLPWVCSQDAQSITGEVMGTSFPYRFKRIMALENGKILVRYSITNLTSSAISVVWAAHMLFSLVEGMYLELPDEIDSVINAFDGGIFGRYGRLVRSGDMSFHRHASFLPDSGLCGKWYTSHKLHEGRVTLISPSQGIATTVSFPTEQVPYLGIWITEGGWNGQRAIGVEPANAAMDSPSKARRFGMEHILPPHAAQSWSMELSIAPIGI